VIATGTGAFEAHVAAGPNGFAVVWSSSLTSLKMARLDATGAPIGGETIVASVDAGVARFPRVTPLGDGWAVSYWDGVGPSLVRVDVSGRPTGSPLALRSGDETGGMTDAPIAVTSDGLVVTWVVRAALMGEVVAARARPKGARAALLSCK
jgi:hypothetical protein